MRTHGALRTGSRRTSGTFVGRGSEAERKAQCATLTPAIPDSRFPTAHMPFIHSLAFVCGNVTLKPRASVWPFVVIRGDTERIEVGEDSNIQDGTIVHADHGFPTIIGDRVGIGHRAVIHGAIVEPDSLIGMGAILLNGVHVGTGSIVAAGAVCREGMHIPPNSMVMGVPGRIVRETTAAERERIRDTVASYVRLQAEHAAGEHPRLTSGPGTA